jgi:LAO/AO transport system kinase
LNYKRPGFDELLNGILQNDRITLSRAITLVESVLPADQELAAKLIDAILPHTGNSIRIAITGVPGVGKSTFIEALGKTITAENKRMAVLTVDPSSQISKGSILGDKTRMEALSKNKLVFIRPSASGDTLGGVANRTREAILLCEAAGFEVIVIETVGVGQSEVAVKNMVDFFLLLMLAGAGDELQGIKKGIMEMADAVIVTKADGDNIKKASEAKAEYQHALHFQATRNSGWTPQVMTCSALTNNGIDDVWRMIKKFRESETASGFLVHNRKLQNTSWFSDHFFSLLRNDFSGFENLKKVKLDLEHQISDQKTAPNSAALKLLEAYHQEIRKQKD